MKTLTTLQNHFQDYLLQADQTIEQHVIGTDKVPSEVRLAIYGNAYHSRLIEALADNYPRLRLYLGDEAFNELGVEYLTAHPSLFRSIRWFGNQLASFLTLHPHYQSFPYLVELARFEWTMTMVFDGTDGPILQLSDLATVSPENWETMRLEAHPASALLELNWNVVPIWQALSEEKDPPQPEESHPPVSWIIWRSGEESLFCSLPADEAWAIQAMLKGATFGELCEGLCEWVDEEAAPLHAASFLKGWLNAGFISKIHLEIC